ncbi:hypothetical protein CYY_008932, partial [Polysphondylium violaceum]
MYFKMNRYVVVTVLCVLLFVCCIKTEAQVPMPIKPIFQFGVEPYATSGVCHFNFVIEGIMMDDISADSLNSCEISNTNAATPLCSFYHLGNSSSSFGLVIETSIGSSATPSTNMVLKLILKDLSFKSFFLNSDKNVPFSYSCEEQPTLSNTILSNSPAQLLYSSNRINTFQFKTYLTLNSQINRPLGSQFACYAPGMYCVFKEISVGLIKVVATFQSTFTEAFPETITIIPQYYTIATPLTSQINSFQFLNQNSFSFKNNPALGYRFDLLTSSTIQYIPPIYAGGVPLEGQSFGNFSFYYYNLDKDNCYTIFGNKILNNGVISKSSVSAPLTWLSNTGGLIRITIQTQGSTLVFTTSTSFKQFALPYPFGVSGAKGDYAISFMTSSMVSNGFYVDIYTPDRHAALGQTYIPSDSINPLLLSLQVIVLNSTHSVLKVGASDDSSGVDSIILYFPKGPVKYVMTMENLVSGNSLNGVYEIIVPFKKKFLSNISVQDVAGNSIGLSQPQLDYRFGTGSEYPIVNTKITEFYFSPLQVDVAVSAQDVVLYANLSQTYQERMQDNSISLQINFNPNTNNPLIPGIYDDSKKLYAFPFRVPEKMMASELDFYLILNGVIYDRDYFQGPQGTLTIKNNGQFDMMFPICTQVVPSNPPILRSGNLVNGVGNTITLAWDFEFYDMTGIKTIIIGISGEYDVQGKNFTIDGVNGKTHHAFTLEWEHNSTTCRDQHYEVNYMYTEDILGNKGETIRYSNTNIHPYYLIDSSLDRNVLSGCETDPSTDTNAPKLVNLNILYSVLVNSKDVFLATFTIDDEGGAGISESHLPSCYLESNANLYLGVESTIFTRHSNGSITYRCDITMPISLNPLDHYLSIYGVYDLNYNVASFTSYDIQQLGFYNVAPFPAKKLLFIESTSSLATSSEILYIYGNGFYIGPDMLVDIKMDISSITVSPNITTGSVLVLYNLPPSFEYKVNVYDKSTSISSNIITIKGPLSSPSTPPPTSSPSTPPPTSTPSVTPSPMSCKSDCGVGQGYGKCVNGGCVCVAPRSGIDCSSIIDTKPVIKPDPVKPSVNVTIPGTSESIKDPEFISFIYVVALRELDAGSNPIATYQFNSDKWILVNEGSSTNEQVSTVQYKYLIDNSYNTTIISTVQVFAQATNITFGNQQLYMNPSTIKFTFNVTSYPFSKSTNSLQLVMTASLQSTEKVACSYKEFVDDQNNSQYLKIQIQDRSLFGRFINFGMIDGREQTISNTILDASYGGKELSKSTSDQSYIGLNIPYYTKYALLDPDFSVLVESRSAKDQANSICTNESKKLTTAQIVGIAVGGGVFLFIIGAGIIYLYTRKSTSPIAMKLRRLGGEQYASASGSCAIEFVMRGTTINFEIDSITLCTLSSDIPFSGAPTCHPSTSGSFNSSDFLITITASFGTNASIYKNINLKLYFKDSSSKTFILTKDGSTPLSYSCQQKPDVHPTIVQISGQPQLIYSSYQVKTFHFTTFLNLNPQLLKPIQDPIICLDPSFVCSFVYVKLNTYFALCSFLTTHTGELPTYVRIGLNSTDFIQMTLPTIQYKSLMASFNELESIYNAPYAGYTFNLLTNTSSQYIPPILLPLIPLHGQGFNNISFYFQNYFYDSGVAILSNTITTVFPVLNKTSNSAPTYGYTSNSDLVEIILTTNTRFNVFQTPPTNYYFHSYPFGLVSGANTQRFYRFSMIKEQMQKSYQVLIGTPDTHLVADIHASGTDSAPPTVTSMETIILNATHSVLRITAADDISGVSFIVVKTIMKIYLLTPANNLVKGNLLNGVYEITVPFKRPFVTLSIMDIASNINTKYEEYGSFFYLGAGLLENPIDRISTFYFNVSQVDVATSSQDVVLKVNISQTHQQRTQETTMFLQINFNPYLSNNPLIQGIYNPTDRLYEFLFRVPEKLLASKLDYSLFVNEFKIDSFNFEGRYGAQGILNIKNNGAFDMVFPIVTRADPVLPEQITVPPGKSFVAWDFEFTDVTGIKKVIIGITGEKDIQGKNFTVQGINGQADYSYRLEWIFDSNTCLNQKYWVNYVYTEDVMGNKGESVRWTNNGMHPYYKFDDDNTDYFDVLGCTMDPVADKTAPTVSNITFNIQEAIGTDSINITFTAQDVSGISNLHIPVCYLNPDANQFISAKASILGGSKTGMNFLCSFSLSSFRPKTLTYYLSIYGIADYFYNFAAYSSLDISSSNQNNSVTLQQKTVPYIESASSLETSSKILYLYGKGFKINDATFKVEIQMDTGTISVSPDITTGFILVLYDLEPSYQYKVKVLDQYSFSNTITIKGPVATPPPTTPPITPTCKSDCGVNQGYGKCVNGGCVCNPPRSGVDCSSIIDTTPVIIPDPVKPSVNVTIPGTGTSIEDPQFTSFVSVLALQELDPNENEKVVIGHVFNNDKWIIVDEGSFTNEQVSTVQYKYLIDNSLNTTIVSTVQVFAQAANITFGNQQLYMNPSTIKFTFNITSYPF